MATKMIGGLHWTAMVCLTSTLTTIGLITCMRYTYGIETATTITVPTASALVIDTDFNDTWFPTVDSLGDTLRSIAPRIQLDNERYPQLIPRRIYQTWITNSFSGPLMRESVHSWIHLNPEYHYYFFNDTDCEQWILQYCGLRYLRAYLSISDSYGAARADYFRYLLMWQWGGIYVDIDSKLNEPLRHWIRASDEFVTGSGWDVPNQFMLIAKPNHTIYRHAALELTSKLEKRTPFQEQVNRMDPEGGVLSMTGPKFLKDIYLRVLDADISTGADLQQDVVIRKIPSAEKWWDSFGGRVSMKHDADNGWLAISKEMSNVRDYWRTMDKAPFYAQRSTAKAQFKAALSRQ